MTPPISSIIDFFISFSLSRNACDIGQMSNAETRVWDLHDDYSLRRLFSDRSRLQPAFPSTHVSSLSRFVSETRFSHVTVWNGSLLRTVLCSESLSNVSHLRESLPTSTLSILVNAFRKPLGTHSFRVAICAYFARHPFESITIGERKKEKREKDQCTVNRVYLWAAFGKGQNIIRGPFRVGIFSMVGYIGSLKSRAKKIVPVTADGVWTISWLPVPPPLAPSHRRYTLSGYQGYPATWES